MPFPYLGSKKTSARHYPPPAHSTIIEPFAGAAAYALWWWRPGVRVILIEKNPTVVEAWHRLQKMSVAQLLAVGPPPEDAHVTDPVVAAVAGQFAFRGPGRFTRAAVDAWGDNARLVAKSLPIIRDWTVIEGDYRDAQDLRATWFVDPPYANNEASKIYAGSDGIDYAELGEWCQSRRGQVIVCEQAGADWLPFVPLARRHVGGLNGGSATTMMEALWHRSPAQVSASNRHARQRRAEALERQRGRRTKRVVLDWDQPPG